MKKLKYLGLLVIAALTLQSCATILAGSRSPVHVKGNPPMAQVYFNGSYVGTTPIHVKVPRGAKSNNKITIKAQNYHPTTITLTHRLSVGYLFLDIVSGVWPTVIDFVTGDIYAPYPKTVKYNLQPIGDLTSKFHVGDKVVITAGKYKNLSGVVTQVLPNGVKVKFTRPATLIEKEKDKVNQVTETKLFPYSVIKK